MRTINYIILFIAALSIISCAADETKQTAAITEIAKSDTITTVSDAQKEVQKVKKEIAKPNKKKLADIFVYSKEGKLVEKIVYTIKNGKHLKNVYKYNADGRKIAWDRYNEKGVLEETIVFHEAKNTIKKKDEIKEKEAPYKFAFKFNEQGKRTEWKSFNEDGSIGHSFSYKYDKEGRETEWKSIGASGQTEGTNIYTYDDKGRKSEWQHFNEKNEMDYKYIYSYDDNGKQSAKLIQIAANDKLFVDKEVK